MIDSILYEKWLRDPVTAFVFAAMESRARPKVLAEGLSEHDASYTLGYTTGFWDALDGARSLVQVAEPDLEATYELTGETADGS